MNAINKCNIKNGFVAFDNIKLKSLEIKRPRNCKKVFILLDENSLKDIDLQEENDDEYNDHTKEEVFDKNFSQTSIENALMQTEYLALLDSSTKSKTTKSLNDMFSTSELNLTNAFSSTQITPLSNTTLQSENAGNNKDYELIAYIMAGCGVFLILVGSFFIYNNYRRKRQKKLKQSKQKEEARKQQIKSRTNKVHHDSKV